MLDIVSKPDLQLILCSNASDLDAFRQAGFHSIQVCDDVQDLYRHDIESGWQLDPALSVYSSFVLAFPYGYGELRDNVAVRLGDTKCSWVAFDAAAPSASILVSEHGSEALRNALVTARPMWLDEVCTIDDVPDPGPEQTFLTGIKGLDDHGFRLVRPAFMPVIGPYGSGKSVLLRQLAASLWRKHRWRTLMTSFEEKIKPRILRDLRRHLILKPVESWTAEDTEKADTDIRQAFRFLRRKRGETLNMGRLLSRIEFAVKVYGVEVVIVDPVNEIDHEVPRHLTKTDYMGQFIMALKALADDYNLLMIVAAHPPKDGVEKRLSKGKLLTLNDGADTSHWGNKADIGLTVWRPSLSDGQPTLLHIDKLKDYETMGKPTLVELKLDSALNRFEVSRTGYDLMGEAE